MAWTFGYRLIGVGKLEIVEREAVLIREAVARVLAGEGVAAIATD